MKTMDAEKVTTSRGTDDRKPEGSLHDYVGGVISNPELRKKGREEETDIPSKTGAKER